jgi:hypothetical protein
MIGELFASVPGQRPVKFAGQSLRLLDERRDDAFGILVRDLDQHRVARMAFDKCCDIAVPRSANQVALPVAWDRTIFNRCWSFSDGYSILWPSPFRFRLACLERRIVRFALRCSSSSFFSTPRA